jgi:ribosomal protein S18 acetylase RimI-like enzyme
MPEPVTIEAAKPADAIGISRVHTRSWQQAYRGIFPDEYLDNLDWRSRLPFWEGALEAPDPRRVIAVARRGGAVIGFAAAGPARDEDLPSRSAEIFAIYVEPDAWSQGAGAALLDAVIAGLAKDADGFDVIYLWVLEDNHRARRFYEAHGFRPDGGRLSTERGGTSAAEVRYRRSGPFSAAAQETEEVW